MSTAAWLDLPEEPPHLRLMAPSLEDTIRPRVLAAVAGYRWGRPTNDRDRAVWATCQSLNVAMAANDAASVMRLVGELERLAGKSA